MSNITTVTFTDSIVTSAEPLYAFDYGQILEIEGLELPATFEVHFCNPGDSGTTTQIGTNNQVEIPDTYLTNNKGVVAYIYLHTGANDGETEYQINIPVRKRPEPSDEPPTPAQQSAITEAIAALNAEVEEVEKFKGFVVERITNPKTTYADAIAAYNSGKRLVCHVTISGKAMWLSDYYVNTTFGNEGIYFCVPMADGPTHYYVVSNDEFTDGNQMIADWSDSIASNNWQPVQGRTIKAALDTKVDIPVSAEEGQFIGFNGSTWGAQRPQFLMDNNGILGF